MNGTLALPSHAPTSRSYTPGTIPETVFQAQNGATSFVRFGARPVETKLVLSYQNVNEDVAYDFAEFYNRCITEDKGVRIGENNKAIQDIKDPMLMGELVRGVDDGLTYRFEKPPQLQAGLSGRYNVVIELVGTLVA